MFDISQRIFSSHRLPAGLLLASFFVLAAALVPVAQAQSTLATPTAATTNDVLPAQPKPMSPNDATSGTLLFRAIEGNGFIQAPLQATDVKIEVTGLTARTKVTQSFYNPTDGWVEGIYAFPLPEDAGVDVLKMQIGDRFIEGKIKERQEAKRIYEKAKREGKKASLLEQERPNLFTNSVANIGPHEVVVVQIEYQQGLKIEEGEVRLRFPMVVAPRFSPPVEIQMVSFGENGFVAGSDPVPDRERISPPYLDPRKQPDGAFFNPVNLTVSLRPGYKLASVDSPFHAVTTKTKRKVTEVVLVNKDTPANRDFELIWKAKPESAPTAALFKERFKDEDYIYALLTPPVSLKGLTGQPRETIFVIDNSGSMSGTSIRQAKQSLLLALDRLATTDRFNVIRFDDTMETVFPGPVVADSENINYAKRFVAALDAEGGTMMLPALKAALIDPNVNDTAYLRQVIFLTDGAIGNEAELFAEIGRNLGRSRLFTVGIGSAPNLHFMNRASTLGRGTFTYIGDLTQVAERMNQLFTKLETPVLTDLVASFPDGVTVEAWPNPLPDLYAGEPILITAKMPKAKGKLVIEGQFGGERWAVGLKLKDAARGTGIAKIWARRKIASLEQSRFEGGSRDAIEKGVLQTALDYSLVSRLTSLVAVDVTPSRPRHEELGTAKVPLNIPEGWDFEKVFGPSYEPAATIRADAADIAPQFAAIQSSPLSAQQRAAQHAKGINLPQGATLKDLERLLGLALLALALLILFADPLLLRRKSKR